MSEMTNRTDDWHRLSRSGYFRVIDRPGEIVLKRMPPGMAKVVAWSLVAGIAIFVAATANNSLFRFAALAVAFPLVLFSLMALANLGKYATVVSFRPDGVRAIRCGMTSYFLPRQAMQQITTDSDAVGLTFHMFVADVGFFRAFAHSGPMEQTLMNNILVAAFRQPLHLDLPEPATWEPQQPSMPQLSLRPLNGAHSRSGNY